MNAQTLNYRQTARVSDSPSILRWLKECTHFSVRNGFDGQRTAPDSAYLTDGKILLKRQYCKPANATRAAKKPHKPFLPHTVTETDAEQIFNGLGYLDGQPLALCATETPETRYQHYKAHFIRGDAERQVVFDVRRLGYALTLLKEPVTLHRQHVVDWYLRPVVMENRYSNVVGVIMPLNVNNESRAPEPEPEPPRPIGKLGQLLKSAGMTEEEYMRSALFDGTALGICTNLGCDYTTDYEPDQAQGYCEMCGTKTVVSGLRLMGAI